MSANGVAVESKRSPQQILFSQFFDANGNDLSLRSERLVLHAPGCRYLGPHPGRTGTPEELATREGCRVCR